eukprot:g7046.t1
MRQALGLLAARLQKSAKSCWILAGCIFHYDQSKPEKVERDASLVAKDASKTFSEEDHPNFTGSFYSETKGYVENMLREFEHVLTLRVRMPIDGDVLCNKRNFIYKISHYNKVVNIPNSMTVLPELLPYAVEMALRRLTGIYNFCNPGAISHNQEFPGMLPIRESLIEYVFKPLQTEKSKAKIGVKK